MEQSSSINIVVDTYPLVLSDGFRRMRGGGRLTPVTPIFTWATATTPVGLSFPPFPFALITHPPHLLSGNLFCTHRKTNAINLKELKSLPNSSGRRSDSPLHSAGSAAVMWRIVKLADNEPSLFTRKMEKKKIKWKEERKKQSSLGSGHWVIKIFFQVSSCRNHLFRGSGLSDGVRYNSITASVVNSVDWLSHFAPFTYRRSWPRGRMTQGSDWKPGGWNKEKTRY